MIILVVYTRSLFLNNAPRGTGTRKILEDFFRWSVNCLAQPNLLRNCSNHRCVYHCIMIAVPVFILIYIYARVSQQSCFLQACFSLSFYRSRLFLCLGFACRHYFYVNFSLIFFAIQIEHFAHFSLQTLISLCCACVFLSLAPVWSFHINRCVGHLFPPFKEIYFPFLSIPFISAPNWHYPAHWLDKNMTFHACSDPSYSRLDRVAVMVINNYMFAFFFRRSNDYTPKQICQRWLIYP